MLLKEKLIDEFYISLIPVLLGKGIPLFAGLLPRQNLSLADSRQFDMGLVRLHYLRI
jgi:dihydrofolate reductase